MTSLYVARIVLAVFPDDRLIRFLLLATFQVRCHPPDEKSPVAIWTLLVFFITHILSHHDYYSYTIYNKIFTIIYKSY
jgi:hypothetical protein